MYGCPYPFKKKQSHTLVSELTITFHLQNNTMQSKKYREVKYFLRLMLTDQGPL